jgi:GH15 family glucan-1,4-alpha-glucosidase
MAEAVDERYRPIADYAIIGDTRSAALISSAGSIDWLCWPRFDSRSVFARILDYERGGHFSIRPDAPFTSKRRYVGPTNVLETTFTTESGIARLTDLMPVMREADKRTRLAPFRQLLRRIEVIEGEVPIIIEYDPRPNYARSTPKLRRRGDAIVCDDGPTVFQLRSDASEPRFTLRKGERRDFALSFDSHAPAVMPHIGDEATAEIERTLAFWNEWSSNFTYEGEYRDEVLRSALALKLLTYAPSGAIVAAPTTSLPEHVGGVRNWDYRFCWLRDASFTVAALDDCGFDVESGAFVNWLLYSTRLTQPNLQILYDIFGEARVPESTLDHLEGYAGSRPVRVGNGAHDQFQLDVYGEVLGAVEEHLARGEGIAMTSDVRGLLTRLADQVAKRWREPDNGIWEKRSGLHQHVHAKVMAWSALDVAGRLLESDRWNADREAIKAEVLDRGFNAKLNSFVGEYDGDELDASLLYVARVGFLPADDRRMLGTIDAIRGALGHDDLVYRYDSRRTNDGFPAGEGAFLACSFWLVEALALACRTNEARDVFEKLCRRANDVGLLSEQCDVASGALVGNFPQALTHIGLINAAVCLSEGGKKRRGLRRRSREPRS